LAPYGVSTVMAIMLMCGRCSNTLRVYELDKRCDVVEIAEKAGWVLFDGVTWLCPEHSERSRAPLIDEKLSTQAIMAIRE
jgi:hypothetical protein